jgi:hypothetical protein
MQWYWNQISHISQGDFKDEHILDISLKSHLVLCWISCWLSHFIKVYKIRTQTQNQAWAHGHFLWTVFTFCLPRGLLTKRSTYLSRLPILLLIFLLRLPRSYLPTLLLLPTWVTYLAIYLSKHLSCLST